ncbi:MAG: hypothetical protein AAGA33_04755 [Pseudomonadota bacterium]
MTDLHELLVFLHIAVGSVALVLFWVPALSRKGSRVHKLAGRFYVQAMMVVVVSAAVSSIMVLVDPIGIRYPGVDLAPEVAERRAMNYRLFSLFLFMLAVLVFASLRHGILSLRTAQQADLLRKPLHRLTMFTLGALALGVGVLGVMHWQILLIIFAGLGLALSIGLYQDSLVDAPNAKQRARMHLGSMIGSGIGAHTAFFAFGGTRFLSEILTGQWQVIPWILPGIIGIVAIRRLERRYQ